jgi:hypothetical protein
MPTRGIVRAIRSRDRRSNRRLSGARIMMFEPPHHGSLGWLTAPTKCGHSTRVRPASVSILRRGLSPTARSGLHAERRRLDPMVVHSKRRAFLASALKGGASRAHIGEIELLVGPRCMAAEPRSRDPGLDV